MAGSFRHIVAEDGTFSMSSIDNLGDAHEALDECFKIIRHLTQGDREHLNNVLKSLRLSTVENELQPGGRYTLK
jgi:hypothetical protein